MEPIYYIVFGFVIITSIIAYFFHKSILGKAIATLTETLKNKEQIIFELQQEKQKNIIEFTEVLNRANKSESRNEILQEQYAAYLLLKEQHQIALNNIATLTAQLKYNREKLDNQQNDMLRLREQLKYEFNEMSQKIIEEQSKKFTVSNEEKIKQILDPLKANLAEFKIKVEETYDKESKERFSLGREVHKLIEMSQVVSQEANNLTTALKGNNKVQGNWGEMILESLLENSGLTKGREYMLQEFIKDTAGNIIKDENGRGLQPDVIIYYPDQRKVIIDSKVSLVAWEQCLSCSDIDTQQSFLKEHIRSIRQHIDGLTKKNYPKYALALDYVLLFIPIEPAFLEAVKGDLQLWKFAYDRKILLVSPTNLFTVLKIISDLWKVEQQNKNAFDIAEKAGALYDKFYGFIENMEMAGKKLSDANIYYNEAFKQLSTGRGNIINKIEELKKMGAKTNKQIQEKYLSIEE